MKFFKNLGIKEFETISSLIKQGKIIIFPTETVYGIGCDAFNKESIKKIYEIKKREKEKPFAIYVNNKEDIFKLTEKNSDIVLKLIKHFLPGPLTLVLKASLFAPDFLVKSGFIGIRWSSNEILQQILINSNIFLAGTSANISNNKSPISIEECLTQGVDIVIDQGETELKKESTVIKIIENKYEILRQGVISEKEIKQVIECE